LSLLIRSGVVVTMNDRLEVVEGDVSIRDGRIAAIASTIDEPHDRVIDAGGGYVLPGLIQTHVHLCQTLFRGYADDLPLMDWLHCTAASGRWKRPIRRRRCGRPRDWRRPSSSAAARPRC
jgi:cytosine/adenosine deaminase-related metal-dependent hydrolase